MQRNNQIRKEEEVKEDGRDLVGVFGVIFFETAKWICFRRHSWYKIRQMFSNETRRFCGRPTFKVRVYGIAYFSIICSTHSTKKFNHIIFIILYFH